MGVGPLSLHEKFEVSFNEIIWRIMMRLIKHIVAFVSVAIFACVPVTVFSADKDVNMDRAQARIQDMHTKLKITMAQEEQWSKVAEVMRENAKAMDTLTQSRMEKSKSMTAVEDLNSYKDVLTTHLEGVNRLIPAFSTLYSSMSAPQKKEADELFRHGPSKAESKYSKN